MSRRPESHRDTREQGEREKEGEVSEVREKCGLICGQQGGRAGEAGWRLRQLAATRGRRPWGARERAAMSREREGSQQVGEPGIHNVLRAVPAQGGEQAHKVGEPARWRRPARGGQPKALPAHMRTHTHTCGALTRAPLLAR